MTASPSDPAALDARIRRAIRLVPDEADRQYLGEVIRTAPREVRLFLAAVVDARTSTLPSCRIVKTSFSGAVAMAVVRCETAELREYVVRMYRYDMWKVRLIRIGRTSVVDRFTDTTSCADAFMWIARNAGIDAKPVRDHHQGPAPVDKVLAANLSSLCRTRGWSEAMLARRVAPHLDQSGESPLMRVVGILRAWQPATEDDVAAFSEVLGVTPELLRSGWETAS